MASTKTETVGVEEARRQIAGGKASAVDVRPKEKFGEGHVPGAIHLPDADPKAGTKEIDQGEKLIVIGEDAEQAKQGASKLSDAGYEAVAVDGDMSDWLGEGFQIQPSTDPDGDTEVGRN
jgi:rhodanese-related sulfurtransferase